MPRLIRSSCIAILASLITSSYWPVASAAETRAQTPAGAPVPGGACSLITKEEVAAALAVAVTGPKEINRANSPGPGSSVSSCSYQGSGLQALTLTVTRLSASFAPTFREGCAKTAKDGLDGLGDLACWYNAEHQELHAFKGATFVNLQLRKGGDTTEVIKGVMKKALERLK